MKEKINEIIWNFPRWSVIRHLQDIGLTRVSKHAKGLTLDLGGHRVRQRGFFRLEKIPNVKRVCLNYDTSHNPDVQADAHFLPFREASFDTVWTIGVMLYCHTPLRVFLEAARVLRPGGNIIVYEPFILVAELNGDWHRLAPAGMRRLGDQAGLETIEIRSCGGLLGVILQAMNDQFYYRSNRGFSGRVLNRILAPFLPKLIMLDDRLCRSDSDYPRYTTGWIYVGQKPCAPKSA